MDRNRIIALSATAIIALLLMMVMMVVHISVSTTDREWPPRHDGEVAVAEDEQYFEVMQEARVNVSSNQLAAPAKNPEPAKNQSDPAPTTGHDVNDRGAAGNAPATATSSRPSPVKQQTQPATNHGPSQQQLAEEEARRRANAATSSAFNRAEGQNNTSQSGANAGNSGNPNGSSTTISGSGTGSVGGGWRMPAYQKVRSTVTGTIRVRATVRRDGTVSTVEIIGGTAPAATDRDLCNRVKQEVKSRRFTRTDDNAPETATAFITYTFK